MGPRTNDDREAPQDGERPENASRRLAAIPIPARFVPWLLVAGLALTSVLIQHAPGADLGQYLEWSLVFLTGDIFAINTVIATPHGLPLTQWSFGPGLLMAVPDALALQTNVSVAGFRILTVGSFFLTWLGVLLLLPREMRGSLCATTCALLAVFYGSHAGYTSHHHSSESLSLLLVVWLAVFLADADYRSRWKTAAFVLVGCLLCLCRLKLAPVAGAFFVVWAVRAWNVLEPRRRWTDALVACLLLSLVVLMIGIANHWMTGSFLDSPYTVGDESFRTGTLLPRFLPEILLHPWHGLLVYHPLYAAGIAILVTRLVRRRFRAEDALALFALGYLLYVHAGWFCWWLGSGSFGMRAVAPISVLLVLPVFEEVARRRSRWLAWGLVVPVFWSLLLYTQGESNFYDLRSLLEAQSRALSDVFESRLHAGLLVIALGLLGVSRLVAIRGPMDGPDAQLRRVALPFAALVFAVAFAVSGSTFYRAAESTRALMEREGQWSRRDFQEVNDYNREAVAGNLAEYELVEGYEEEKAAIRDFLARNPGVPYRKFLRDRRGPGVHEEQFRRSR